MNPSTQRHWAAFTLSELLVAVAILGLIATFTVPKVLQGVENNRRVALFRETYSIVSSLTSEYLMSPSPTLNLRDYLFSKLQTLKVCPNGVLPDGCRTVATDHSATDARSGVLMVNGVIVNIATYPTANSATITIDYNGDGGPNIASAQTADNIILECNGESFDLDTSRGYYDATKVSPGKCLPWNTADSSNIAASLGLN
jgi:prepilin-type N-terminal cleavage/methylation domain-containing protein